MTAVGVDEVTVTNTNRAETGTTIQSRRQKLPWRGERIYFLHRTR